MMLKRVLRFYLISTFIVIVKTVDRQKFKTCQQSGFCKRSRAQPEMASSFEMDLTTLQVTPTKIEAVILNTITSINYRAEIFALKDNTFRIKIREAFPLKPRFEVPDVLYNEPRGTNLRVVDRTTQGFTIIQDFDHILKNKVIINAKPFKADFYSNSRLILTANARGLMRFEHTQNKDEANNETNEGEWEETYGGHTDSKPNGPNAVAMDFEFHETEHVYGIPEHADHFSLQDTSSGEPYRLYNLDVFEYELWNAMALYAAVPFMIGHNEQTTTGLFWLNAAETWIDIKKSNSGGVLNTISNYVANPSDRVDTHWISESGIIDFFVLLGPRPKDVNRQYAALTGSTPLPPIFSLGYHQSRWNYNDQDDVSHVEAKFDEHDISMDVMWLDIEHTDDKKYFTWDSRKFMDPLSMINSLALHGRKMVTIIDPHIKKDVNYWIHTDCVKKDLYVKNKDGSDFEGHCWPGASHYGDFLNPATKEYFANQYLLENYVGSTLNLYTWNDMNEPSVFSGPEITMPKDLLHYGGWEHRDLHNIYGHLYTMATHAGQLLRSHGQLRPFILTRSAFAGTQRYAALWTGDNTASWSHLQASVPMCLSLSLAGISFCGADVGGFFGNPDGLLFVRWYQAAAFQPFFRSHAHIDTKRREPWLYGAHELKLIRESIRWRYSFIPLWYTLFYEGELNGVSPMRSLWIEFPQDKNCFGLDDIFMVGDSLLVRPIYSPDENSISMFFPGGIAGQIWYDIFNPHWNNVIQASPGGSFNNIAVVDKWIPVFQRGGTIIAKKERLRRSVSLMHSDPYTLIVALDATGSANGTLYIDDGKSFEYKQKLSFAYLQFTYKHNKLTNHLLNQTKFVTKSWLERVVILGASNPLGSVFVYSSVSSIKRPLVSHFDPESKIITIRKPDVNIVENWEIHFE